MTELFSQEEALKMMIEDAQEEGIQKGIEKGIEKGREEGMQKERNSIVKNLLSMKMDIPSIIKATGLDEKTIRSLML